MVVKGQRHGLTAGVHYQTASKAYNNNRETWRSGLGGVGPLRCAPGALREVPEEQERGYVLRDRRAGPLVMFSLHKISPTVF